MGSHAVDTIDVGNFRVLPRPAQGTPIAGAAAVQVPGSVEAEIDDVKQGQGFGQGQRIRAGNLTTSHADHEPAIAVMISPGLGAKLAKPLMAGLSDHDFQGGLPAHSVIVPLPMGCPRPLPGTVIVPENGPVTGQCTRENVAVNPVPPDVAVMVLLRAKLTT